MKSNMSKPATDLMEYLANRYIEQGRPNWLTWHAPITHDLVAAYELRDASLLSFDGPSVGHLTKEGVEWILRWDDEVQELVKMCEADLAGTSSTNNAWRKLGHAYPGDGGSLTQVIFEVLAPMNPTSGVREPVYELPHETTPSPKEVWALARKCATAVWRSA